MKFKQKTISRVSLADILRKKRTNLEKFLKENGIVTYEKLEERCSVIGVIPPDRSSFLKALGETKDNPIKNISSPTEGIVVLEALPEPPVQGDEQSTEEITDDSENILENAAENQQKPKRTKKKNQ